MKKLTSLTILFIMIYAGNISSQITLTSAITPRPGDVQFRVKADTAGINPGNPGPGQTWNFNSLTRTDSSSSVWISAANTPYGHLFPASKIAMLDTCYTYFDTLTSRVDFVGQFTQGTAIPYSNYETIITYPFGYNSTNTDNFAATINQNGDIIHRTGTITVTGDAWGTIHLSFGTFNNALRLKYQITTRDSSSKFEFVLVTNYTIYEWYVPGRKFNVFNIAYIDLIFPGDQGLFSFKNVFYNPSSATIGIETISSGVPDKFMLHQNYPNPFNPLTKIKFDLPAAGIQNNGLVRITVYDLAGREVAALVNQQLRPGSYEVEFDGSNLASGIYFYTISAGEFIQTKKLTLIK